MDLSGVTEFRAKVYKALLEVSAGNVITYAALGKRVGCGSSQAIGQAMRHNPFAPEVPCHRVIKSDFSLGGYQGKIEGDSVDKKIKLLAEEGVKFDATGKILEEGRVLTE